MDRYDVKEVMDQVHISSQMQEKIIMNIQKRMENENKSAARWNWRKMATAAAVFVLAAGVISFPVRAFVTSVVKERMESIPKEEVQEINDMVQSKPAEADVFSREYSDSEEERKKALWQEYKDGKFPENVIAQVENAEDAPEGTLCYIRSTGVFNLPAQEMTDEEILEIIDFQHKMSYAVSQGTAAQEARAEEQEKIDEAERRDRALLEEKVKAAGGISEDEAIEIARKAMEADIGEKAKELEVRIYPDLASNGWKLRLYDITDWDEYKDKGDIAYSVQFGNKEEVVDPEEFCDYHCMVNAVDGSICGAYSLSGDVGLYWDYDDIVWYEH
ncbi:MAG: hypothetical protein K2N80_09740 [Lachnospiraceae bacterium]|nr:hypothetical protein [Lachnospiraceae bacterium]